MSKEVVVFTADWCSNCQPYKETLREKGIAFTEVDVETEDGAKKVQQYGVRGLPTTIILRDGHMERRITGTGSVAVVVKELEN